MDRTGSSVIRNPPRVTPSDVPAELGPMDGASSFSRDQTKQNSLSREIRIRRFLKGCRVPVGRTSPPAQSTTDSLAQFEVTNPPSDAISAVRFAPRSTKVLVASWDCKVYLYALDGASSTLVRTFEHRAPVLDVCWDENEERCYSAGLDWDVRRYDLSALLYAI